MPLHPTLQTPPTTHKLPIMKSVDTAGEIERQAALKARDLTSRLQKYPMSSLYNDVYQLMLETYLPKSGVTEQMVEDAANRAEAKIGTPASGPFDTWAINELMQLKHLASENVVSPQKPGSNQEAARQQIIQRFPRSPREAGHPTGKNKNGIVLYDTGSGLYYEDGTQPTGIEIAGEL